MHIYIFFLLDKYQILVGIINCREAYQKKKKPTNPTTVGYMYFFLFFFLFTVTEKSMLKTKLRHQRPTAYLTCIEPHCEV